ncbi:hypothetical protein L211DRAFT_854511 [Terfezia boudieri ATCC MYA-4762]|uniref:Uncharacterized protein n=1 Tax=Terfezia boudieri ATCC MYA-4762 TaxID=1051890 RepID=A0A3N4L8G5_9PEZI|nr:hypothetical protein L211DRAFT_854511 [Terfezia boudieri ATCC MYA-4762]
MVEVWDVTSIYTGGVIVNSTGGFCMPVFGIPPGHWYIPRKWIRLVTRVALTPQDLELSEKAWEIIQKHNKWYMVQLLHRCSGSKDDFICRENEFQKSILEVIDLEPTNTILFTLIDIEQSSTEGNLCGICRMLMDELKIPKDDFMQGISLVS